MNSQQTQTRFNAWIAEANRRQALAAYDLIEANNKRINNSMQALMFAALNHFVDANLSNYERTFQETLASLPEGQRPGTKVINCARREFIRIMQWAYNLAQSNREGVFV